MSKPRYGDNIYELGAVVGKTLRMAKWERDKVDSILSEISAAPSYDEAVAICRNYITIQDDE